MKGILKNAAFRAVCILIAGILFISQPQAATWFTIVTGVCFILPGSAALVSLFGRPAGTGVPFMYVLLSVGCILFGLVLVFLPDVFQASLLYVMAALLVVLGAVQLWSVLSERKRGILLSGYFLVPPVLLVLAAIYLFLFRLDSPEVPPFVVTGCAFVLYALSDLLLAFSIHRSRKKVERLARPNEPA